VPKKGGGGSSDLSRWRANRLRQSERSRRIIAKYGEGGCDSSPDDDVPQSQSSSGPDIKGAVTTGFLMGQALISGSYPEPPSTNQLADSSETRQERVNDINDVSRDRGRNQNRGGQRRPR
jgi:uncharacterized protein YgiB involved in biofilm formation